MKFESSRPGAYSHFGHTVRQKLYGNARLPQDLQVFCWQGYNPSLQRIGLSTGKMYRANLGLGGHYGWNAGRDQSMAPPVCDSDVANPSHLIFLGDRFKGGKAL